MSLTGVFYPIFYSKLIAEFFRQIVDFLRKWRNSILGAWQQCSPSPSWHKHVEELGCLASCAERCCRPAEASWSKYSWWWICMWKYRPKSDETIAVVGGRCFFSYVYAVFHISQVKKYLTLRWPCMPDGSFGNVALAF